MKKWVLFLLVGITTIKVPFFFTHHIQEDAYITWRVASNILEYGVIGFNGAEKISSSTTHLYTFICVIFQLIFGKSNFIFPVLLFNCFLFAIGSILLAQTLLKNKRDIIFFVIFINLIPPALKASYLGMEYALIFFLICCFLNFGIVKKQAWALFLFPILLLWTRLDAAIFLGISFIIFTIWTKKWNWVLVLSGCIGLVSVLSFNYLYFGEILNHTIKAKQIAYQELSPTLIQRIKRSFFYISVLKQNSWLILGPSLLTLIGAIYFYIKLFKSNINTITLSVLFVFSMIKWFIFRLLNANFDWYYWIPQIGLMSIIFIGIIHFYGKRIYLVLSAIFIIAPMLLYSIVHSIATGNGEWNHRAEIGRYLNEIEPDKNQYIMLEPAGYIPYYSNLKTIDEVGLVHKGVTEEMEKDFDSWWINSVNRFKPKYLLTLSELNKGYYNMDSTKLAQFHKNYKFKKKFEIKDALKSDYIILQKIYELKPSGRNYYLYEKTN